MDFSSISLRAVLHSAALLTIVLAFIAAAASLGKMNARDSIPSLKHALKDKNVGVILAAASSLRVLGDPSAYLVYYAVLTGERDDTALVVVTIKHGGGREVEVVAP